MNGYVTVPFYAGYVFVDQKGLFAPTVAALFLNQIERHPYTWRLSCKSGGISDQSSN